MDGPSRAGRGDYVVFAERLLQSRPGSGSPVSGGHCDNAAAAWRRHVGGGGRVVPGPCEVACLVALGGLLVTALCAKARPDVAAF